MSEAERSAHSEADLDADVAAGLERAADLLAEASHTVVLTGVGISKESGIPTFRGPDGLWTKRGEPPMNGFQLFSADPRTWWQERIARAAQPDEFRHSLDAALPNAGHLALAELERMGAVQHVITQNVDDLHLRAGTHSLTEIHGNMHWLRCVGCHARWSTETYVVDAEQLPPRCLEPGCDAVVKGDGVMFGESIPPYALERCAAEARLADVFMIIGTTAQVYPAAEYPQLAVRRGVPLIEIDPDPTALTDLATVVLRGPAGELLPRLVEAVRARGAA